jgi:ribosomal protein S18 acetylase RimI-like enzyme
VSEAIGLVREEELPDLLPLVRAYCDFYEVAPAARGTGLADRLIAACADRARAQGAAHLVWQTAPDNKRAQRVYDRVGGRPSAWIEYEL